jgi:glutaredoxin
MLQSIPAMAKGLRSFLGFCLPAWLLGLSLLAFAAPPSSLKVYLFSAEGCPHCREAKKFLAKLEGKHPHLRVIELELTGNRRNQGIFKKIADRMQVELAGVPCIFIGATYFVGWQDVQSTGAAIERAILEAEKRPPPDLIAPLFTPETRLPEVGPRTQIPETLNLPIIGTVETRHLSLGLLTVIIGAMDGFNPCAMWALVFLIGLLLGMENRTRMWVLGSLFIGGSGLVYFFFMTAWLNVLLFLGLVF